MLDSDKAPSQSDGETTSGSTGQASTAAESTGFNTGMKTGDDSGGISSASGDDTADDYPEGAKVLGILTDSPADFGRHSLSDSDRVDYFKFSVKECGKVTIRIKQQKAEFLRLKVTSAKPNANQSDVIQRFDQSQQGEDHSFALPAGDFYLAVETRYGDYVEFDLSMFAVSPFGPEPTPDPGNHFDEALKLGSLDRNAATVHGYVGEVDLADVYHFEAPANKKIKVSSRFEFGDYKVELYRQDHVSGELAKSWYVESNSGKDVEFETNEGGGFFLKVVPWALFGADGVIFKMRLGLVD